MQIHALHTLLGRHPDERRACGREGQLPRKSATRLAKIPTDAWLRPPRNPLHLILTLENVLPVIALTPGHGRPDFRHRDIARRARGIAPGRAGPQRTRKAGILAPLG
jgi:hypothetical protein